MNVSQISNQSAASTGSSGSAAPAPKPATPAPVTDTVHLSQTAQSKLKGGDPDSDGH